MKSIGAEQPMDCMDIYMEKPWEALRHVDKHR